MFSKYASILVCSLIFIVGCEKESTEIEKNEKVAHEHSGFNVVDTQHLPREAQGILGEFTKNGTSMPIKDSLVIWEEDDNLLRIVLTPSKLSPEKISRLNGRESPFFIFADKQSPNHSIWQWHPYVIVELRFKTKPISTDSLGSIYVLAYGIEAENFTDNINGFPDDKHIFKELKMRDGQLAMSYEGYSTVLDDKVSWRIGF